MDGPSLKQPGEYSRGMGDHAEVRRLEALSTEVVTRRCSIPHGDQRLGPCITANPPLEVSELMDVREQLKHHPSSSCRSRIRLSPGQSIVRAKSTESSFANSPLTVEMFLQHRDLGAHIDSSLRRNGVTLTKRMQAAAQE